MDGEKENKAYNTIHKNIKFKKEREIIINKLNDILKITSNCGYFWIDDMTELQKLAIDELVPEIKKFFVYGTWLYFKKNKKLENKYVSLIKCIYKDMNYQITQNSNILVENGKKVKKRKICIEKPQEL